MGRRANAAGVQLIKDFETLQLHAYPDPATHGEPYTIGWGHTGPGVTPTSVITQHQAEAVLDVDLDKFERAVEAAVKVSVTDNQFSALVSIVFNVGPGAKDIRDGVLVLKSGQPSTLLRKLNAGDYAGAADQFLVWNKAAGRVLKGLTRRREAERDLFLRK